MGKRPVKPAGKRPVKPAGKRPVKPVGKRPVMDARIRDRRRAVRQEQARRRRRVTLSVAGLVLVLGAAYGVSRTPLFAVGAVRVAGVDGAQAAEVREAARIVRGGNILDVDIDAASARVERLPWVRDARVSRAPAAIEIRVVPRRPTAVVSLGRSAWVLDDGGWVMGGGAPSDLVLVDAPGAVVPPVGQRIAHPGVRTALAVHAALPEPLRAMVERYDATSDRALRFRLVHRQAEEAEPADSRTGVWVRFGLAERIDAKVRVIELLLEQARQQAALDGVPLTEGALPPDVAELDVRAPDNPVVIPSGRTVSAA